MYAITFDIDTNCLNEQYTQEKYNNAYGEVRRFLESNSFTWQQGSTYFGDSNITAVDCVTIVQDMAIKFSWFANCVKDIRMLRIEENNNLMPAIQKIISLTK
jgi:virulence-associated protein VapD